MKNLILLCLLFLNISFAAQDTFLVTGKFQSISYHQGGVELTPDEMRPFPLSNKKLFVVKFMGNSKKSVIVQEVISNFKGEFEITLAPGKYGFIEFKSELRKGIFLPEKSSQKYMAANKSGKDFSYQAYWELNTLQPFEVTNSPLTEITLTHYSVSICYTCP